MIQAQDNLQIMHIELIQSQQTMAISMSRARVDENHSVHYIQSEDLEVDRSIGARADAYISFVEITGSIRRSHA